MDAGGPKHGWARLRHEANELRTFLAHSPDAAELGEANAPPQIQADDGVLRSFYFASFLGPREYNWGSQTVSPKGCERLKNALAAREAVLAALDVTDYEAEKQTALAGAGLRYVRYGSVPPWLGEPRQPRVHDAARNPRHPHFDPDARKVWQAGVGTSSFSKLIQWSFDPVFNEPDFTDGLAAAFHAVTSRVTAAVASDARHETGLEDMIHPKLLASLQDAMGQISGGVSADGGVFHHEIEIVGAPWLSHLTLVCGGQRDMPLSNLSAVVASSNSAMDGGAHVLVTRRLEEDLRDGDSVDLERVMAGGFGDSAVELARRAVDVSGAMLRVCVNYETREFLASKDGRTGEWTKASFEPWRQMTRQWVFESPFFEAGGDLAEPDWRVVDMDGLLNGNANWDRLLQRQRAAQRQQRGSSASYDK
jgi:hypothetical protein